MQINWDTFKAINQDSRGAHLKFEDLCRLLFANENLSGNGQFRYLHSNPNDYGLEAEPIFDEKRNRWIGFRNRCLSTLNGHLKGQVRIGKRKPL